MDALRERLQQARFNWTPSSALCVWSRQAPRGGFSREPGLRKLGRHQVGPMQGFTCMHEFSSACKLNKQTIYTQHHSAPLPLLSSPLRFAGRPERVPPAAAAAPLAPPSAQPGQRGQRGSRASRLAWGFARVRASDASCAQSGFPGEWRGDAGGRRGRGGCKWGLGVLRVVEWILRRFSRDIRKVGALESGALGVLG